MMFTHGHFSHRYGMRFARKARDNVSRQSEPQPAGQGRGGRHHGGARALGRFFAHGDLRLVILKLIAEKPRHGYEVIKAIEDSVAGAYSPSPGVIYPTLTLLEELGYVTAEADGAKKLYSITAEGLSFLTANRATVEALEARIAEAGGGRGGRPQEVMRAMYDLKSALRARMSEGRLTAEQLDAISAAIDEATAKIGSI